MATAQLEKVQELLTCAKCADKYTDPCTLNCQHTFCRNCITKYTKTRPEALQSKTIPCPSCRQVTKVPDPTKPVDRWAWQIKPSIIILGLIDTSQPDPTTTCTGRTCHVCQHLGATTRATPWCPECEMALCDRCARTHYVSPASHDHEVCDLSPEVKVRRRHKVVCREHEENCIEFHCKDCKKSACQKCCIIYHRACKSVLSIQSMKQEMALDLVKMDYILSQRLKRKSRNFTRKKDDINRVSQNKLAIKSQIQTVSQKAIDKIKEKEKRLMDKLDEVIETQRSQLQADVKLEEIEIQMHRQYYEFIDKALDTECVMDMYNMYQACESGTLVLGDTRSTNTADSRQIKEIRFTQDSDKKFRSLDDLQLGKIDVTYEEGSGALSSPVLCDMTETRTKNDKHCPQLADITVLTVEGIQTVIVADFVKFLKSFHTRRNKTCNSTLSFNKGPWGVTRLKENQVMVTVPDSNQIITVKVTTDLVLLSTITTKKGYRALAVISPSSLAAGCGYPDYSVDIMNMAGQVMTSVSTHNNLQLFGTIWSMCVNEKGNIFVSDHLTRTVTCLTSGGVVLWQQTLGYCRGITTNGNDDILVLVRDNKKVIQLTGTGQFVREVLTWSGGGVLHEPTGICMDRSGSLFVSHFL